MKPDSVENDWKDIYRFLVSLGSRAETNLGLSGESEPTWNLAVEHTGQLRATSAKPGDYGRFAGRFRCCTSVRVSTIDEG